MNEREKLQLRKDIKEREIAAYKEGTAGVQKSIDGFKDLAATLEANIDSVESEKTRLNAAFNKLIASCKHPNELSISNVNININTAYDRTAIANAQSQAVLYEKIVDDRGFVVRRKQKELRDIIDLFGDDNN